MNTSQEKITLNKDDNLVVHATPEERGTELLDLLSTFDDEFIEILEENYQNRLMLLPTVES